jgi:hypothetical protein
MTLSRVLIDASKAFEYGQTYVALSRCVSREGLWITGPPIGSAAVKAHSKVIEFYNKPDTSIYDDEETTAFWGNINIDAIENNNNIKTNNNFSMNTDTNNTHVAKLKPNLSPEVAQRIAENKKKALMKLKLRQQNVATDGFNTLSPEQQMRIAENKRRALMKLQAKKKRKHKNISTTTTSEITTTIAAVKSDEFDMYGSNDDIDWDKIEEEVRQSKNKKQRVNINTDDAMNVSDRSTSTSRPGSIESFNFTQINDLDLQKTLCKYFGYKNFRDGQLECIKALLCGKNVAVFWATGKGKSMVYQMPSLFTKKITIVVSPLISLMVDQVKKLNSLTSVDIACYLGSAQMDPFVERKALNGEYLLIYLTPEKIAKSSFLNEVQNKVGFVAIDEAHCVSNC